MTIDRQKFNIAYNALKEIMGDHGAFILFLTKPKGGGFAEDFQIRTHGEITKLFGLLNVGTSYTQELLTARLDSLMKELPREPD